MPLFADTDHSDGFAVAEHTAQLLKTSHGAMLS
jgi:hypothetical protein